MAPVFLRSSPRQRRLPAARLGALALLLALQPAAGLAQTRPAVPAPGPVTTPALARLPGPPPPMGLPQLQGQVSCPALQQRIQATLGGEVGAWSISVADPSGRLLAEVNGRTPRVPASNMKLISTAFALDQLGPDHRLSTRLWQLPDGSFRLTGEGDPDLALPHLQRFAQLALRNGGSSGAPGGVVRLELAEEPSQVWWPSGWNAADRVYAYGAPITRLAVTSNAIQDAVQNPPARLQSLMERSISQQGGQAQLRLVSSRSPLPDGAVLLYEQPSAPMHNLLSLANSESHNFTAEVLMRQTAGTWDLALAQQRTTAWLMAQGLPLQGVRVVDGSGLDRSNRLTSHFIAALLLRMDQHPYARQYLSSMAVSGQRGTLRNIYTDPSLQGRFYAKTGTLRGVRAISGVLLTNDGARYVAAIANGSAQPNTTIGQVLRQVQASPSLCPG